MKKFLITLGLLAFIILGTSSVAKATVVRFYININISDTCHPTGYTGKYCVEVQLKFDNLPLCNKTVCNLSLGSQCVYFDCDVPGQSSDCYYQILLIAGSRSDGSCSSTPNISSPNECWSVITDSNCPIKLSIVI
jgi:hypothetical protein